MVSDRGEYKSNILVQYIELNQLYYHCYSINTFHYLLLGSPYELFEQVAVGGDRVVIPLHYRRNERNGSEVI
jgi:hypothetical protein